MGFPGVRNQTGAPIAETPRNTTPEPSRRNQNSGGLSRFGTTREKSTTAHIWLKLLTLKPKQERRQPLCKIVCTKCPKIQGSHNKVIFLVSRPLRKRTFCEALKKSQKNVATKLEGADGKALGPLIFFLRLPLLNLLKYRFAVYLSRCSTDLRYILGYSVHR